MAARPRRWLKRHSFTRHQRPRLYELLAHPLHQRRGQLQLEFPDSGLRLLRVLLGGLNLVKASLLKWLLVAHPCSAKFKTSYRTF